MANRPPGATLVRTPTVRPPSPVWTPSGGGRTVYEVARVAAPALSRAPGPLRILGVLLGIGLVAAVVGKFLWDLLNQRGPRRQVQFESGALTFAAEGWIRVKVRMTYGTAYGYSCFNGSLQFITGGSPGGLVDYEAFGKTLSVPPSESDFGYVCGSGGEVFPPHPTVSILRANGSLADGSPKLFGRYPINYGSAGNAPLAKQKLEVVEVRYNNAVQSLTSEQQEVRAVNNIVPVGASAGPATGFRPNREPKAPPIVTPTPEEVPGLVPQPEPEPAKAPPSPVAPPVAPPVVLPGGTPRPSRPGTGSPGGSPGTTPLPQTPGFPSQDPNRPTQPVDPATGVVPLPRPPVPSRPPGTISVGNPARPIEIVPRQVPPTLEGIALELGRIERKQEIVLGDPANNQPDWLEKIGAAANILGRLIEILDAITSGTTYTLQPPCEVDENGDPVEPFTVEVPGALNRIDALQNRIDALAVLLQAHKDQRQPVCRPTRASGQPVTVTFREVIE